MDSLFLFQFACFIFMLINAFIVALSHLHVRWENKRYERSRWMIVAALIGLAIQYVLQMTFGFRAMHDNLGAVINILLYTPCFSLISIGIYNIETTRANRRKMILMCSGIYAAIIVVFCVGISLHHSLYIREGLYLMLTLFCVSVFYCIYMIIQEMIRRKNEYVGDNGSYRYVALCEIFARKCNHSMARSSGYACCHLFHHLIIYSRSCRIACHNVLQPYVYRSRKQLYSYRRTIGQRRGKSTEWREKTFTTIV